MILRLRNIPGPDKVPIVVERAGPVVQTIGTGTRVISTASCLPGEVVDGGGFNTNNNTPNIRRNQQLGNGWTVEATGSGTGTNTFQAYSLDEAGDALDYQKDVHPRGKVVITV